MSRRRTLIRLSAVLAVVALAKGCGDGDSPSAPPTPEPARPTTVTVSRATHELTAFGATVQLSAEVRDQNARVMAGATVTWTSSASSVATVDASGLVTAVGNGTATITASAGSASGSAVVTVTQSVASVEVSPATAPLTALGATVQLTAEAFDENGHAVAGAEFSWESSDAGVATVDAGGLVTAVGNGTATITATAGSASGTATVTVAVGPRVTLDGGAGSAPEGGVVMLGLTVDAVPESAISVRYTLGTDDDPVTSDADGSDYTDGGGGAVEIAAGASGAVIEITINDDDEIESVREVFTVTLEVPTAETGYQLGSVTSVVLTIEEGVCDRTPQVGDEIVQQAGVGDCAEVEDRHLASIQELDLCFPKYEWMECDREDDPITELREGDFLGFSGLTELDLQGNDLNALSAGVFSGLSSLDRLGLGHNVLTELPTGVFSGLASLEWLRLDNNQLVALPVGVFSGLSNLGNIGLGGNGLTALPEAVFSGLSNLWNIGLGGNGLTELPAGIFSGLSRLNSLDLYGNDLTALPAGVFSGLASLEWLSLGGNPGSPFTLTAEVARTDSDDPMSPGPATLEFRVAEGAPFAMTIPLSVRGGTLSTPSVSFAAGATAGGGATLTPDGSGAVSVAFGPVPTVCEDLESNTEGPKCSGLEIVAGSPLVVANPPAVALSVPAAHLTQTTQDLSGGIPLIAGRQALLRVFGTADERYILGHEGQATFFVRDQGGAQRLPGATRLGHSHRCGGRPPRPVLQREDSGARAATRSRDGRGAGSRRGPALEAGKP